MERDTNFIPLSFIQKKTCILKSLNLPCHQYNDLSPKGSVDERIYPLISQINHLPGFVTTSSCAGRTSVFIQGKSDDGCSENPYSFTGKDHQVVPTMRENQEKQHSQSMNGKGTGGRWLFVSHDPLSIPATSLSTTTNIENDNQNMILTEAEKKVKNEKGLHKRVAPCMNILGLKDLQELNITSTSNERREDKYSQESIHYSALFSRPDLPWIHFKFEPMILHVLTASLAHANLLLRVAIQAGFRESGALNLMNISSPQHQKTGGKASVTPMVAIRSTGLLLESVVGLEFERQAICIIPEWQLRGLMIRANERFEMNSNRINRLVTLLGTELAKENLNREPGSSDKYWEEKEQRRHRKREEGLRKAKAKEVAKADINSSCFLSEWSLNEDLGNFYDDIFRE